MSKSSNLPVSVDQKADIIKLDTADVQSAEQNPALVYLASLAEGSRPSMRGALATVAAILRGDPDLTDKDKVPDDMTRGEWLYALAVTFPWHQVRYQHTQAVRTVLMEQYAPRTANKKLSALRGVLKECWRLGLMESDDYMRAVDIKAIKGAGPSQAETGRHVQAGELSALMAACMGDGTDAGIRDAAIIALGYMCGLRRAEMSSLMVNAFDTDKKALTVTGKGAKTRVVYVENGALDALTDWLHVRGSEAGPMFLSIRRGDHMTDSGMTPVAINQMLQKRAEQAGVKDFSPHDLRRTFAGDMLDAGVDIATVQKIMGHSSVSTTAGYDRRDAKTKRAAAAKLHIPYVKKYN